MNWRGWKRNVLIAAVVVAGIGVFIAAYGWLPWLVDGSRLHQLSPKDQAGILGNDRGDVLKFVAGVGAVVALVYTARKHNLDRKAHALSEQGQVTDRYTKAITQLASDKESERIGGIYALERVMADSERDHPTVVEVLAAFVRQHAPLNDVPYETGEIEPTAADAQAAMTVLSRRPKRTEPFRLDLRHTNLCRLELSTGARLGEANLQGAHLIDAVLVGTDLSGANLQYADLSRADLGGATLDDANLYMAALLGASLPEASLRGAKLVGAKLTVAKLQDAVLVDANLTDAELNGARLLRANLTKANLWRANLTGAYLAEATLNRATFTEAKLTNANLDMATILQPQELKPEQLADALVTDKMNLDQVLAVNAWVNARLKDCKGWKFDDPIPAPTAKPKMY
jgi:uncharacterized protein YjbI with pentapeptide repeats